MSCFPFFKFSSRIAAALAGVGVLGGIFSSEHAEAGFRNVPEKYQDVDVQVLQSGPTLLFSDSPEMVYENGILYKDIVEGEGRIFFHHVNAASETRKLAVLMRPLNKLTTLTWGCRGIGEPDTSYYASARKGQIQYFNEYKEFWKKARKTRSKEKHKRDKKESAASGALPEYSFYRQISDLPVTTLARGEYIEVLSRERNASQAGLHLKPEQLLTGMFDFHASHPVEIVIMMCNSEEDIEKFSREGTILPMDEHLLRGTYQNADLTYIVKTPMQMKWYQANALCMAGSDDRYFLTGTDRMTGVQTLNYGNYGVVYHLIYSVAGKYPIQLGINPWGGDFWGAGMMITEDKAEVINIPNKNFYFGAGDELDDIFLHTPNQKRKDAEFIWSPPGASNLPIRVFWTVDKLENRRMY